MAQESGTQIIARARLLAQDNDVNSNYAVSAADALILLNDVLVSLSNNVRTKPKWIPASTTGLTFNAGNTSVVMAPASIGPMTCTVAISTSLTSTNAFGSLSPGMFISGTGITPGTTIAYITDASTLTMSDVGTGTPGTYNNYIFTYDLMITEIESFHQSNSSSLTYPISPAIERVSVQEMLSMLAYDGDNALAQSAAEWTHVAAEKAKSDTATIASTGADLWRVWAYPVINRTRYMTIRVPLPVTISAAAYFPDLDAVDSKVVSRLLAYEMAKLKKETSQEFLSNILRGVPQEVLNVMYGGAIRSAQLQDSVVQRND